jgi:alcohol dehydrogenase (cytochrome c)
MNFRRHAFRSSLVLLPFAACALLAAQAQRGLDPAMMLKPPADMWPTYHGDYTGQRHSRLTQITPDNVHQLTVAWTFQTGSNAGIKATPILVDGVMYVTMPDNIWAIDARNGRQLWKYTYPTPQGTV